MSDEIKKALDLYKNQDYQGAANEFENVLKADENNPNILNNIGLCYAKLANDDKAEEYYLKALSLNNKMVETYVNLADLYYKQKRIAEAINLLESAVTLMPDNIALKHYLARIYIDDKRYDLAIDQLSEVLDASPKNTDAYWDLGNVYFELGEYDNAVSNYEHVLELVDNNAIIYYQTALAYEANDNIDKAISNHLKAAALNSNFHPAYKKLGILFMARNDIEDAIEYFNDYLKFDLPKDEKDRIQELITRISK